MDDYLLFTGTVGELHTAIETALRDHGPQTLEGLYRRVKHTGASHFDFAGAVRGLVGAERIHFDGRIYTMPTTETLPEAS